MNFILSLSHFLSQRNRKSNIDEKRQSWFIFANKLLTNPLSNFILIHVVSNVQSFLIIITELIFFFFLMPISIKNLQKSSIFGDKKILENLFFCLSWSYRTDEYNTSPFTLWLNKGYSGYYRVVESIQSDCCTVIDNLMSYIGQKHREHLHWCARHRHPGFDPAPDIVRVAIHVSAIRLSAYLPKLPHRLAWRLLLLTE